MSRLTLPFRECPECRAIHAAFVCHVCKTPIHGVPIGRAESRESPPLVGDLPAGLLQIGGRFSSRRRAA